MYRCRQTAFNRTVAVKVFQVLEVEGADLVSFRRECQAIGQLDWCPNIITVFDAGTTEDGKPYLAMEYAPDGSLATRVRERGPLASDEVSNLSTKVAHTLSIAHAAAVIHRDVKPGNILTSRSGEPLLADFGYAAVPGSTQTRTGAITATIAHAAPEVLNGERPTAASDIYSLGSTLFMLLAGRAPFSRDDQEDSAIGLISHAPDGAPFRTHALSEHTRAWLKQLNEH